MKSKLETGVFSVMIFSVGRKRQIGLNIFLTYLTVLLFYLIVFLFTVSFIMLWFISFFFIILFPSLSGFILLNFD